MLEGMLSWLGGETTALLIWAAFGAFVAALLWLVMVVWKGGDLPLSFRSERLPDGRRRPGSLAWLVAFVMVIDCMPVGLLLYNAAAAVVAAVVGVVTWFVVRWPLWLALGLLYGGWRLVRTFKITPAKVADWVQERRAARRLPAEPEPAPKLAHNPVPLQAPTQELPVGVNADGSLRYVRAEPVPPAPAVLPDEFFARPGSGAG
jgi:hypothetical protein